MTNGLKSDMLDIKCGVPQGSVLGPILYIHYMRDIPSTKGTSIAKFVDGTSILAIGDNLVVSTSKLQNAANSLSN